MASILLPEGAEVAPVRKRKLSDAVIKEIRRMIQDGELKIGQKLPDHTEFAKHLQVSRTTLREALHTLHLLGVIRQRSGAGTVLIGPIPARYEDSFLQPRFEGAESIRELLETRKIMEIGAMELSAQNATEEEIDRMRVIVEEMRRTLAEERTADFIRKDLEFHFEITKATHNRFLIKIFENLRSFTEEFMVAGFRAAPGTMKPSLEQHGRIFKALKKKDGKAARQEMEKHVAERLRVFGPILKEREKK
jgi:GntR family transcriptional repressor for pyruvate dehydrogenase complex